MIDTKTNTKTALAQMYKAESYSPGHGHAGNESIQVYYILCCTITQRRISFSHLFLPCSCFFVPSTSTQHVTIRLCSAIPVAIWEELNESIVTHTIAQLHFRNTRVKLVRWMYPKYQAGPAEQQMAVSNGSSAKARSPVELWPF